MDWLARWEKLRPVRPPVSKALIEEQAESAKEIGDAIDRGVMPRMSDVVRLAEFVLRVQESGWNGEE